MLTSKARRLLIVGSGTVGLTAIDEEQSLTEIIKAHALLIDAPVTVSKTESSKTKSKRGRHNERYGFNKRYGKD
jgi:hypothetical protein